MKQLLKQTECIWYPAIVLVLFCILANICINEEVYQVETIEASIPEDVRVCSENNSNVTHEAGNVINFKEDPTRDDTHLLAKLVMAEAEGCDLSVKVKIAQVVLNRVNDPFFPDTVYDVIFEVDSRGVYQFSPLRKGGRWWTTEPTKECYLAVEQAFENSRSFDAVYFESCTDKDNWHSRNLTLVDQTSDVRFYR